MPKTDISLKIYVKLKRKSIITVFGYVILLNLLFALVQLVPCYYLSHLTIFRLEVTSQCAIGHISCLTRNISSHCITRFHDNSSTDISSTTLRLQTFRLQTFRLLLYTSM